MTRPNGYQFTFTGGNAATGTAFTLKGTGANAAAPTYTVTGTLAGETYLYGVQNTATTYPGPAQTGKTSTFNVNLLPFTNVPSDTYTDNLTVAVSPL